MKPQSTEKNIGLSASLDAVVEWSLQPENQQIRPVHNASLEQNYQSMLNTLDKIQVEREVKASFSPY